MLKAGVSNSKQDNFDATGEPIVGAPRRKTSSVKPLKVLDTTMQVTTPENISFHYQLAGPFRRILSYFLDIGISLGAYSVLCFLVFLFFLLLAIPFSYFGGTEVLEAFIGIISGLRAVGWFIVYWFYGAFMEAQYNGQTLGKRITKMRVITTDGHAIDGVQATLRNFFRLLDVMPMVSIGALFMIEPTDTEIDQLLYFPLIPTCLFGLIVMTINRRYQRVGDLVANTVVVNEELNRLPNLATFMDERVPLLAEMIPTSFVVPASMAKTIADYVDRRKFLPYQRASEIASHLARPLMEKFGIPPDTDYDLFLCALYHKTFSSAQLDPDEAIPLPKQVAVPLRGIFRQPENEASQPSRGQQPHRVSGQQKQAEQTKSEFQMDPNDFRINK